MVIRNLDKNDYTSVLVLYTELDRIHYENRPDYFGRRDCSYPKKDYDECLNDPNMLMLGAFENDELLGIASATLWNKSGMIEGIKTVCLDNIYVLPEARRKGIAKSLFAEVESWGKQKGAVRLDLHVWGFNKNAISMYEAMAMTPQRYVFEKDL